MLRTRRAVALGTAAWVVSAAAVSAQPPSAQWGALRPGRYSVGFRRALETDHSRRVAPPTNFEGKPNPGPLGMTLPVAIWYPATPARNAPRMQYGMLAAMGTKRTDMSPITAADRATSMGNMRAFAGFAFGRQISEATIRAIDTTMTAAVLDAAPAAGRFPVVLAATDGSVASSSVLFEYLASHGIVVMAVPSRMSYATIQVSRPTAVVEARVRDFEFLLDHARRYPFADTTRFAVFGTNFDGMAALAFQMKNMAARAVVSLDGWEGKQNSVETVRGSLHYDPRRMRVPYLVVLQDEAQPSEALSLNRGIFDALVYSDRQWLVMNAMTHAYLIGNPLAYPDVPAEKRAAYELLVRSVHRFLDAALGTTATTLATIVTAEGGADSRSGIVKDVTRQPARPAVPDDAELERLIMVDRAADKVAAILRDGRKADSSFVLFPQQTMALYAFRFTRQNDLPFALRLLALNAEAFPRSWGAADALGNGYRDAGDSTRAIAEYTRAIGLLAQITSPGDAGQVARVRQGIEEKIAKLR